MLRSALAVTAIALAAAPAAAASYSATLTQPLTSKFIARDIVWSCGPAACQGATDESPPGSPLPGPRQARRTHRHLPGQRPCACGPRPRQMQRVGQGRPGAGARCKAL